MVEDGNFAGEKMAAPPGAQDSASDEDQEEENKAERMQLHVEQQHLQQNR